MTDATRHGLFRRLRRATSRPPLVPDPLSRLSGEPASGLLRSPWLRQAFGLESDALPPRIPRPGELHWNLTCSPSPDPLGASGSGDAWPAPEHIVEPVWLMEADGTD